MRDHLGPLLLVLFIGAILLGAVFLFDAYQCGSRSKALGLEASWGPVQGCIVTRQDGVKVDIDNYGRSDRN